VGVTRLRLIFRSCIIRTYHSNVSCRNPFFTQHFLTIRLAYALPPYVNQYPQDFGCEHTFLLLCTPNGLMCDSSRIKGRVAMGARSECFHCPNACTRYASWSLVQSCVHACGVLSKKAVNRRGSLDTLLDFPGTVSRYSARI